MVDVIWWYLGLKRLESGAFVKDYEGSNKEVEQAVQMCLSEVISEDPRYLEREAPPLSEEFPDGSKIFFLGEHAYGVAAQVSATTNTTLSVILAVRIIFGLPDVRTLETLTNALLYIFSSSPLSLPRTKNSRLSSIIASRAVIILHSRRPNKLA